jgi:hypothetical protein
MTSKPNHVYNYIKGTGCPLYFECLVRENIEQAACTPMERTSSPAEREDRPLRVVVSTIVTVFVVCALYSTFSLAGIKSDLDVIANARNTATVG